MSDQRPHLHCGLLALRHSGWFEDLLFACSGLSVSALDYRALGLSDTHNPYDLRLSDRVDVALVTPDWYGWLHTVHRSAIPTVFARLRRHAQTVVGYEGVDTFDLALPPEAIDHLDLVIKAQGLYHDRERYNLQSGPVYPARNRRVVGSQKRYESSHLDKLRLSVPCFLGVDHRIRARVRKAKPDIGPWVARGRRLADLSLEITIALAQRTVPPSLLVHCVCTLTHVSRLDVMRVLRGQDVSGDHCVTEIPELVWGTDSLTQPIPKALSEEWTQQLSALEMLCERQPRWRYRLRILAHRAVLAPTGYGELTFRQAEAWISGRALICPSLSFAQTMFPFKDRENVLFARPDWSDLPSLLSDLADDDALWTKIGTNGRRAWLMWRDNYDHLLRTGILDHLHEALHISDRSS